MVTHLPKALRFAVIGTIPERSLVNGRYWEERRTLCRRGRSSINNRRWITIEGYSIYETYVPKRRGIGKKSLARP